MMAAAEAMTEGAWSRLATVGSAERFTQPTITGVDFPTVALCRAEWDPETQTLLIETAAPNDRLAAEPTSFRVANLPGASRFAVESIDAGPRPGVVVDGDDLQVTTTVGSSTLLIRPSVAS